MIRPLALLMLVGAVPSLAVAGDVHKAGAPLEGLDPAELAPILDTPEAGHKVRLEGTVKAVCQNKGCWLELAQGEKVVRVTFKDYGFFVPKDCACKRVALEGEVKVEEPDPAMVEHLKGEGGGAAATSKVSIVAAGVEIGGK